LGRYRGHAGGGREHEVAVETDDRPQALIAREKLTQAQAAKLFGVTQPRISDLMRGKIDLFSLDMLVNMLATAGMRIDMHVADPA
jgi:predicted XRE-type DNA-binding protein